MVKQVLAAIGAYDQQIDDLAQTHPDYALIKSFPAAGPAMAPRLIAALGSQRERYESAAEIQQYSGGAMHGYAIAQAIHLLSDEVLKVEEGSLYPALYRLELDGAISAHWGTSENNRRAKYYQITKRGRNAVTEQQQTWNRLSAAVDRVLQG